MEESSAPEQVQTPTVAESGSWPGGEATRRPVVGLLVLLLLVPALLVVAHVMHHAFDWPSEPAFDLGQERGYGEMFWQLEMIWAGAMLLWLAWTRRMWVLGAWAFTGAVLLLDDRFLVHERLGTFVADRLPVLEGVDAAGEVAWLVAEMAVAGVVVLVAHWRSDGTARAISAFLFLLFATMAFFGVVLDALHALFVRDPVLDVLITAVEDGGEIAVMSLIVAFVFAVAFADYRPQTGRRPGALAPVLPSLRRPRIR